MPERKIYILSGPVQSGKTGSLTQWCENKKEVSGILTPVIDGHRFFMDIRTKVQFAMEAGAGETGITSVGRYQFSNAAFRKAIEIIHDSINKKGWLIIDEIGPLELRREGFYPVLKEFLESKPDDQKLLLVVRSSILDQVLEFFQFQSARVIHSISEIAE